MAILWQMSRPNDIQVRMLVAAMLFVQVLVRISEAQTLQIQIPQQDGGNANLIINGSFEEPKLTDNSTLNRPALPGWNGVGTSPWNLANGHIVGQWDYPLAPDGEQFVVLGDAPDQFWQEFTVPASGWYEFRWADNTAIPPGQNSSPYYVSVFDGSTNVYMEVFDAGHSGVWETRRRKIKLDAGVHTMIFTPNQPYSGWGTILDNVSIRRARTNYKLESFKPVLTPATFSSGGRYSVIVSPITLFAGSAFGGKFVVQTPNGTSDATTLRIRLLSTGELILLWEADANVYLQESLSIQPPAWTDVAGSNGSLTILPPSEGTRFYRLRSR